MYEHFKKGVNLGGWLSQFDLQETGKLNEEQRIQHFGSFITEEDIKRLKEWGADHVRLPFISDIVDQYPEYMDRCVDWCEKYDLGIILDLHEIEGHGYMANGEIPRILTDERLINRCVFIWTTLAKRYLNRKNPAMVFELINEIHDPVSYYWKELYKRLVSEIRAIDKERVILIGTTEDRIAWLRDFREILEKHHIGRAYWNYKIMNFGLVDRSGRVVDDELRKTVFR